MHDLLEGIPKGSPPGYVSIEGFYGQLRESYTRPWALVGVALYAGTVGGVGGDAGILCFSIPCRSLLMRRISNP